MALPRYHPPGIDDDNGSLNGTANAVFGWLVPGPERRTAQAKHAVAKLTPRQRQVLHGIVDGSSTNQIAQALGISPRSVAIHRGALMDRLDAKTTADAVRIGIYAGIDLDSD